MKSQLTIRHSKRASLARNFRQYQRVHLLLLLPSLHTYLVWLTALKKAVQLGDSPSLHVEAEVFYRSTSVARQAQFLMVYPVVTHSMFFHRSFSLVLEPGEGLLWVALCRNAEWMRTKLSRLLARV